ncbi:sulfatase [Catenovulum maritimum]|uniref:Sulfatase N-terminal domain-containing protein n=1 Tax=Catenovulum maritimum TaxID=1513271 RepID=A0A0J8JMM3_9ALTE|nr:sulfatase [Catenovulum maritimum]KMT65861.1 hypothetical protein XM47_06600 [Catenovulum maritimum]
MQLFKSFNSTGNLLTILVFVLVMCTTACSALLPKSAISNQADTNSRKPNFVFIAVDDLNIYNSILGDEAGSFLRKVYPDDKLRQQVIDKLTPNLAKLAKQGVSFRNTYSASPLCGPSRTALMTGVPPHISGYYKHDRHFRAYETLTNVTTLPQYLKQHGYYTSGIGKVFHKGRSYLDRGYFSDWPDQLFSWDHWVERNVGTSSQVEAMITKQEQVSKYWDNPGDKSKNFSRFGVTSIPTEFSNDYVNAQHIAQLILTGRSEINDVRGKKHSVTLANDKPYFLAAGIFAPHLPWVVEQKYYDMFPQSEMAINKDLLAWVRADLTDMSKHGQKMTASTHFTDLLDYGVSLDGQTGDVNAWKAIFQAYLATVAYADSTIGVLLDAINRNPQKDNTVVVLWSDHGYHLGDKNWTGKTSLWEAANRANLIIADPRQPGQHGKQVNAPVSLQDIYPSIMAMAELPKNQAVYGYDLTPLVKDVNTQWTKAVLNTFQQGNHALRTNEYRYIRFRNGDQELYNLIQDPLELTNLANRPDYKIRLKQFSGLLDRELKRKPNDF